MMSLESLFRLGWAFAKILSRKLLPGNADLQRFWKQYGPDGIVAFSAEELRVLDAASRCTPCGLCNTRALELGVFRALGSDGPQGFVLGVSRHSALHDRAELSDEATEAVLRSLQDACPVEVPFVPLVDLVRRRASKLQSLRTALGTPIP